MISAFLLCAAVAWNPGSPSLSAEDEAAYQAARSKAGRSAEAQVKLALWCEAHGMAAERAEHLAIAVAADPANAAARGLMGLVADGKVWRKPADVANRVRGDAALGAILVEYNERRAKTPRTADAQWKLALWCEEKGLAAEEAAHLTNVVRLDPSREAAWKRLGYKKINGRWATDEQVAAARAEMKAQRQADRSWKTRFEQMQAGLRDPRKRDEARASLAAVSDPRAVPVAMRLFGETNPTLLVQILGQIDGPEATRALAVLASAVDSAEARTLAVETLRQRDPRDFLDLWIGLLRKEMKYEVRPVGGPGSPGVLFVEGEQFNRQRIYAPPPIDYVRQFGDQLQYDENGRLVVVRYLGSINLGQMDLPEAGRTIIPQFRADIAANPTPPPVQPNSPDANSQIVRSIATQNRIAMEGEAVSAYDARSLASGYVLRKKQAQFEVIPLEQMASQARRSAMAAQAQLEADISALETANARIRGTNRLVVQALHDVTGQDFGTDASAWKAWWTDRRGYAYVSQPEAPKATLTEEVPLAFVPQPLSPTFVSGPNMIVVERHSCFGAGTPVKTRTGDKPIETLAEGDQVLTRDTTTGSLSFQPVLAVFHNPPCATYRVRFGGDAVVATGIHRFWRVGKGWTMARDLKPGDAIRTHDGTARITSVEADAVQPVFNLEVARGHSFFVGGGGALVHDNSLVESVVNPFDAVPALARVKPPVGASR